MARILYAINGEGMGHVTRSTPLIKELQKYHKVRIIVDSVRGMKALKKHFRDVTRIDGLPITYVNGAVDDIETAKVTIKKFFKNGIKNLSKIAKIINDFHPDIIISDFEHATVQIAAFFNIPVICLCNIHAITHLKYEVPKEYSRLQSKTKMIIRFLTPIIKYHIITSFFKLPKKGGDVFLVPPIIREEIRSLRPALKEHILVYQTSSSDKALIKALKSSPYKFIVYGYDVGKKDGNITFRRFNDNIFFSDFKDCRAVITNGGFTLITEAIALRKPILSMPVKNQFEQLLNAIHVQKLGYGEMHEHITPGIIKDFVSRLEKYRKKISKHYIGDNSVAINKINEIIRKEAG